MHRLNPILHIYCKHTGVDLAANIGTPVKASSDGVISIAGKERGYGNVIMLKHNNKYSTLYAHLHNFAHGIHHGSHVRQGQVIGYVGMTGRATGPHLHYEFRINNVPHDPLKVTLPSGEMIAKTEQKKFFSQEKQLLAQLDLHTHSFFAANNVSVRMPQNSGTTAISAAS